jgi:hypothetical protein
MLLQAALLDQFETGVQRDPRGRQGARIDEADGRADGPEGQQQARPEHPAVGDGRPKAQAPFASGPGSRRRAAGGPPADGEL